MKNIFNSKYYDGKSSKAQDVTLILENNHWRIVSVNKSFSDIIWSLEKIQKPEVYISGFYSYTYGEIPRQILEINDVAIEKSLENLYPRINLNRSSDAFLFKNKLKSLFLLVLFMIGIASFSYFVIIPKMSKVFVDNLSKDRLEEIGDYLFKQMEDEVDVNENLTFLIQEFANEIKYNSPFKMKVRVSNKETVNAFAMPGGNVVIYKGLLQKIENENQLLAVLGHEFTHTTKRHVLNNLITNISGYLVISLFVGDANGIIAVVLENAHMIKQLSFTRELETEADIEGIHIIEQNNADPNGMHELFSIMNAETDTSKYEFLDYLSTHPNMTKRIEYTKSLVIDKDIEINHTLREKWMEIKNEMFK